MVDSRISQKTRIPFVVVNSVFLEFKQVQNYNIARYA